MKNLITFLQKQKLLTLAIGSGAEVWTANVYFGADDKGTMYFISPKDNKHSRMMLAQPQIAFGAAWFDPANHKNRKGVQGVGVCRPAEDAGEIARGVALHNQNFPEFKERVTVDWIRTNEWGSCVWVLRPSFIKYWDDESYGDDESQEFTFPAA
ncbi:MAG: hypothetical protein A3F54_03625 [Candidatus Kerfeldbacteria bacterium RIFCSPHIGHO2_12_FULL_48_17]|uniref:Pyridoxamine 5'-phosphate oxidase putative domain-containing protein n=1 Tax=Candidatus Kerfeldbacteria bacterium RIFCSPHIGHO2_12_FULL_48_17 TaxID=1798542 RepID=A0A1G2B194_9BACT|nr:MAG: hypothetical protein A3F54_03625 [Candidatus Kerfeldbacteria bacterium RIFCSPHIGHO2_12_FULL_48_17]